MLWHCPAPSTGCVIRATPEGTPTLMTVLLTGLHDAAVGEWGSVVEGLETTPARALSVRMYVR